MEMIDHIVPALMNSVKAGVGIVNRPLAIRRLRREIAHAPKPFKIEVGGHRFSRPGWIATDIGWRSPLFMDASSRWPFPDGSASLVYSDNVIEHISMGGNRRLFREAHRVLRSGGRIRLATPDIQRLAGLYTSRSTEADWHIGELRRKGYEAHHYVDLLRAVFQDAGHHVGYLWDMEALSAELQDAGFEDIVRFESSRSDTSELIGLERRDERKSAPVMLIVEGVRG